MFRKTILALAAVVTVGAAALAPTSASAGWHGGWHGKHWGHGHWGHGGYGFRVSLYNPYAYGGCYTVKRFVQTGYGLQVRRVTVCN